MMKLSGLFLMLLTFTGVLNLLECSARTTPANDQGKRATPAPVASPAKETTAIMDGEIKELAAGGHCVVFESFVFVARDKQTYEALEALQLRLPAVDADFFKSHAVVAAFLGQRRTGGFSVSITPGANGAVKVAEQGPRGMVTMVLTTPYKIVAVPVKADSPLALSLDATWEERLRNYKVESGEVTTTGGFAGIQQKSELQGTLRIMRAEITAANQEAPIKESLATVLFELQSVGKRQTELHDVASGLVATSGQVSLAHLESYRLSGAIDSPFRVTGQFVAEEKELTLSLETVASPYVSDNFSARASLRAIANTAPPPNRAITGNEQ